jgi:hypothetical protein
LHGALLVRRGVTADASTLADFAARTFADTFAADNRAEDMQAHLASSYGARQQTTGWVTMILSARGLWTALRSRRAAQLASKSGMPATDQ